MAELRMTALATGLVAVRGEGPTICGVIGMRDAAGPATAGRARWRSARAGRRARRAHLGMEPLESRRLLAALATGPSGSDPKPDSAGVGPMNPNPPQATTAWHMEEVPAHPSQGSAQALVEDEEPNDS